MYKQLILKSGRERSLYHRHPWLFSGGVKQAPQAAEGEIIQVRSNHGGLLGYGFYSTRSQIVCRLFEFTQDENFVADAAYWQSKVASAYALRKQHVISP